MSHQTPASTISRAEVQAHAKQSQNSIAIGHPITDFVVFVPFAVAAAVFALASGAVVPAFVGAPNVPVADVDFPFAAEPFAVVAGVFAQGVQNPADVAAVAFAAPAVASVPIGRHAHSAVDDRSDLSWQGSTVASYSAVRRAVDRF